MIEAMTPAEKAVIDAAMAWHGDKATWRSDSWRVFVVACDALATERVVVRENRTSGEPVGEHGTRKHEEWCGLNKGFERCTCQSELPVTGRGARADNRRKGEQGATPAPYDFDLDPVRTDHRNGIHRDPAIKPFGGCELCEAERAAESAR